MRKKLFAKGFENMIIKEKLSELYKGSELHKSSKLHKDSKLYKDTKLHNKSYMKLRTKFFLCMILFVLLSSIVINVIVYWTYTTNMKTKSIQYSSEITNQMAENLGSTIKSLEETLLYKIMASDIFTYQDNLSNASSNSIRNRLQNFAALFNSDNIDVNKVYIFDKYKLPFYYDSDDNSAQAYSNFKNTQAYQFIVDNYSSIINQWGGTKWVRFSDDSENVYLIKSVLDLNTTKYVGIICIAIDEKYLASMYAGLEEGINGLLAIYNEDKVLLSCDDSIYEMALLYSKRLDDNERKDYGEFKDYVLTRAKMKKKGWELICFSSNKNVYSGTRTLFWRLVWIEVMISLVAASVAAFVSKGLTNNITKLIENIKRMRKGEMTSEIEPVSNDESGYLCIEFNKLNRELANSMEKMMFSRLEKEKAEYNALLAQMNPHFLFNTLESINNMAKINHDDAIVESINHMSLLLRTSISGNSTEIILKKELEYANSYLQLQNIILGYRIEVDYSVEEDVMNCFVPKLILQPIIENSIVHGVENMISEAMVFIAAYRLENQLWIEISDNGQGIESAVIDKLLEDDDSKAEKKHTSIGLKSVNKRIKILYGDAYGLEIESTVGTGTLVKLVIPYHKTEEEPYVSYSICR